MTANEIMRCLDNRVHELGLTYKEVSAQCDISKDEFTFWRSGLHLRQLRKIVGLANALGLELIVCKKIGVNHIEEK